MSLMSLFLIAGAFNTFGLNTVALAGCFSAGICNANSNMSATYANVAAGVGHVNCSIWISSVATANSSFGVLTNLTNTSGLLAVNDTLESDIVLEDAQNYQAFATCNDGTPANSSITTGIIFDRTTPTTPTSLAPTGTLTDNGTLNFAATVTGTATTGCNLEFIGNLPRGATKSNTMTHSGNTCSLSFTSVSETTYQYQIFALDGSNSSAKTTSQFVNVDADEANLQGLAALAVDMEQKKGNTQNIMLLLIVGVALALFIGRKK